MDGFASLAKIVVTFRLFYSVASPKIKNETESETVWVCDCETESLLIEKTIWLEKFCCIKNYM